ncbi:MAG: hypothetical protein PVJ15_00800 [Gammaproteobacteria bacterium]|jgi:hypothetical protein
MLYFLPDTGQKEDTMNVMVRILIGTALFAFGYYLGREVSRTRMIQESLRKSDSRRWQPENSESENTG